MTYNLDDDFDFLQVNEPRMCYGASNTIFENAKQLRNRLTESEKILWEYIKEKKLGVNSGDNILYLFSLLIFIAMKRK